MVFDDQDGDVLFLEVRFTGGSWRSPSWHSVALVGPEAMARGWRADVRLAGGQGGLQGLGSNPATAAMVNTGDLVRVGLIRAEDLAAGGTGAECAELARTKEMVSQLRTEVGRQGGRMAEREAFPDLLRQQVGEKDRQIKALHANIERLVASLASRSAS
jgi:uncharacterized small protein (DUF1192 family)